MSTNDAFIFETVPNTLFTNSLTVDHTVPGWDSIYVTDVGHKLSTMVDAMRLSREETMVAFLNSISEGDKAILRTRLAEEDAEDYAQKMTTALQDKLRVVMTTHAHTVDDERVRAAELRAQALEAAVTAHAAEAARWRSQYEAVVTQTPAANKHAGLAMVAGISKNGR